MFLQVSRESAGFWIRKTQTLHVCHICLHWGGLGGQCVWEIFSLSRTRGKSLKDMLDVYFGMGVGHVVIGNGEVMVVLVSCLCWGHTWGTCCVCFCVSCCPFYERMRRASSSPARCGRILRVRSQLEPATAVAREDVLGFIN